MDKDSRGEQKDWMKISGEDWGVLGWAICRVLSSSLVDPYDIPWMVEICFLLGR